MDALFTRAELVGHDPEIAGIGTVVPRGEFADAAARGEFPATLLLDLDRVETGDEGIAHATIAVDWDKESLDQLLASTDSDRITLWFDESQLAPAFDDVEGHGFRERAAVLAVAITAAGAAATPALAGPGPMGAQRGEQLNQQIGAVQTSQTTGAQRGEQLNQQISAGQPQSPTSESPGVTTTGDSGLSSGEVAAIAGAAGAIFISAAGFGIARKHHPPVRPA